MNQDMEIRYHVVVDVTGVSDGQPQIVDFKVDRNLYRTEQEAEESRNQAVKDSVKNGWTLINAATLRMVEEGKTYIASFRIIPVSVEKV